MSPSSGPHLAGWVANPGRDTRWACDPVSTEAHRFHQSLRGYEPTPVIDLTPLADELGVSNVYVKDESHRLDLPAFKALGASWAIHKALEPHGGRDSVLVAATDGNHGRAVAHFARELGHGAEIFVPEGVHSDAIEAIRGEGAAVHVMSGSYDDVVRAAAEYARSGPGDVRRVLVQDTAWPGYEEVPAWIVEGYSTMFFELDEQLRRREVDRPGLVVVPTGVGSLLQASLAHYRSGDSPSATAIVSVEPVASACAMASVSAGEMKTVETAQTVMAGLNCGTLSSTSWPYIEAGVDGCVTVTDEDALTAGEKMRDLDVDAGPCGAASLAAVQLLHSEGALADLTGNAPVVLLVTEGRSANPWQDESD